MLETLDAAAVHRWCAGGLAGLRLHQQEIDDLNVYPVPDGDTGTNLVLTLTAAERALAAASGRGSANGFSPGVVQAAVPAVRPGNSPGDTGETSPCDGSGVAGTADPGGSAGSSGTADPGGSAGSSGTADPGGSAGVTGGADLSGGGAAHVQAAGDDGLDGHGGGHGEALRVLARGALLGARGNSGVIVSQILRGLADALAGTIEVRGRALAEALRSAATAAYQAVVEPAEGTILTVVSAAAHGAGAVASDDLATVARAATAAAARALAQTPQQLPALARAGVVDAGGRGLVVLLEALVEVVTGAPPPPTGSPPLNGGEPVPECGPAAGSVPSAGNGGEAAHDAPRQGPPSGADEVPYEYEVQYLLDADADAVTRLKAVLAGLGDSIAVVGTGSQPGQDPTWNVHVHVNDIGGAIEAGVVAGRPYRISVTPLAHGRTVPDSAVDPDARAAVVVASGGGLAALFRAEGATVVGGNPSPEEILTAVRETRAGQVVVLPNDPDTRAVAAVAAREAQQHGVRVRVVPTRSPVQALAALAVRDNRRRFDDDVITMAEAAGACRYGEACYASREALTVAGWCRPGDVLGLVDGEVHVIGTELERSCRDLLDRMLGGGGELVTLVFGAEAPTDLDTRLRAHLAARWPFADVQSFDGGQPFYPLLVGVE